jgi:hypothetical protein
MRNFILLLIFFLALPLYARDVYKWINEEGVVIYSDTYVEGAERIRVTDKKSSQASNSSDSDRDGDSGYASLEIVQPENDATVRSNTGSVAVGLNLSPTLGEGHSVKILVDGSELEGEMRSTQFTLNNLNRGTHSLETRIVDAEGNVLISSKLINFHLRKASIDEP